MIDVSRFRDGVAAMKEAARQAAEPHERAAWYGLTHHCLSLAILFLPRERIHLNYQLALDGSTHVLVTFRGPDRTRSFHVPFARLSGEARSAVIRDLGHPRSFRDSLAGV